jgi:hypothetical protein
MWLIKLFYKNNILQQYLKLIIMNKKNTDFELSHDELDMKEEMNRK